MSAPARAYVCQQHFISINHKFHHRVCVYLVEGSVCWIGSFLLCYWFCLDVEIVLPSRIICARDTILLGSRNSSLTAQNRSASLYFALQINPIVSLLALFIFACLIVIRKIMVLLIS